MEMIPAHLPVPTSEPQNNEVTTKTKLGRAWSAVQKTLGGCFACAKRVKESECVSSFFNKNRVLTSAPEEMGMEVSPPVSLKKVVKQSPLQLIKPSSTGEKTFRDRQVNFSTLQVVDQSTKPEWQDKCGYHSLKNAIAGSLIHLGLGSQSLLTDTDFYEEIYRCINDARPPLMRGGDVDIATLNSFLKAGSSLDVYIKTKTGNRIGIEELARSISLFNYTEEDLLPDMLNIAIGDKGGLSSVFNYLGLNDKLGKKDHPFVHHVVIGSKGHWVTLSILQNEQGRLHWLGMDSWKNKTDRFNAHINVLDRVSKSPQPVLNQIYEDYSIGSKVARLADAIKFQRTPALELQLLLDKDHPELLESPAIQNLACRSLGLESRETLGAKYILQQLGFPPGSLGRLSADEQEAGQVFLRDTLHFPIDPAIPLNPDPLAEIDPAKKGSHPLHEQLKKEFRTIYEFDMEGMKKDYPQHYYLTKALGLTYNSYEKIPLNSVAQRLLKAGIKDLVSEDIGKNDYPSIFESIDFMRKAGWLQDQTQRTIHAAKIASFLDVLAFYHTHDPTNEKINSAIRSLKGGAV